MEKQEQNVTKVLIDKREKAILSLIFGSPPFWKFDHLPVNSEHQTSKKRAVFPQHWPKTHTIEQV